MVGQDEETWVHKQMCASTIPRLTRVEDAGKSFLL